MRKIIALTLYVSLTTAAHGQDAREQIARYLRVGDYNHAEQGFREAIGARTGSEVLTIDLRNGLGDLLREEGKDVEARDLFNSVLNMPNLGWAQRLAAIMGLAGTDGAAGEPRWMQALALARQHDAKIMEAACLRGLAVMWLEARQPAKAEPLLRRALYILEKDPNAPAWQKASVLTTTGLVYRRLDKLTLAEESWTQSLELYRTTLGDAHPQTAYMMERLAEIHALRGDFGAARNYAARALEAMRGSCGDDSLAVAAAYASKGDVEQYASALPAAAQNYAAAVEIARKHPDNPAMEAALMQHYAALLKATRHDREAKALALEARSFMR